MVDNGVTSTTARPTRRAERRAQTVREIKELAMNQVSEGGPDAVSLSGIVREMSMSPPAVYRYFASRDALLADLVVDAYDELADHLVAIEERESSAERRLDAVLRGTREWALEHPNAYRLIFQSSLGSGQEFAVERTVPASSRSMAVVITALAAVTGHDGQARAGGTSRQGDIAEAMGRWAERTGLTHVSTEVLVLAFLTWTRLHGIISLELGGHLAATGLGAAVLFEAELSTIRAEATRLPSSGDADEPLAGSGREPVPA